jgi:hypothetical protein
MQYVIEARKTWATLPGASSGEFGAALLLVHQACDGHSVCVRHVKIRFGKLGCRADKV